MSEYKPYSPFVVPMHFLTPTTTIVRGVSVKKYNEPSEDNVFYGSFKTFGGTESQSNGVFSIVDTANIETWYRPDITADCRICLSENLDKLYEIIGTPENINMRNIYMKFKVQAINGGA